MRRRLRARPLPPHLRGGLKKVVALLKPEQPNSTRPVAVMPSISPGCLSRSATPPFHRFGEGPAREDPLPPRLRGSLKIEVTQIKPGWPNSACPAAVQPQISPGQHSRGATPPCLGFGEGPMRVGPLPPSLRCSLEMEVAQIKPERSNSAAKWPSSPWLARAGPHTVRHLRALDSVKVPCAQASSLPASGAVSRRKLPYWSLSDLTPPAQRPSSPK